VTYIRIKTIKGIPYAYLVRSEWNKERASSIQHTIKYLGRSDSIKINDIPVEYRNDPKVLSFLSSLAYKDKARKESLLKKLRIDLLEALCNAEIEKAKEIALDYRRLYSMEEFYEDMLTPVMYRIGDLWAQDRLSIIMEHVCSNIAGSLIHVINAMNRPNTGKATVLICSPEGELHHMAADMIESLLLEKGYQVYNAVPSAPVESIVSSISRCNPKLIMISVTLKEHLKPAFRLVRRIRIKYNNIPILVGGQATRELKDPEKQKMMEQSYKLSILSGSSLATILDNVRALTGTDK
jgi:methanogenic corrinoid protein MtbC1